MMNAGKYASIMLATMLLLLIVLPISAAPTMTIDVKAHREYYNTELKDYTKYESFYLFTGDDIQWWQGGAVFVYDTTSDVAKQKIDILTKALMGLFKDLGFVIVAGTVKPTYVKIVYNFDGVLEFEGFYVADEAGVVTVEWSEGEPLVITVLAKATINASTAEYAGRADWGRVKISGGWAIIHPQLTIPMPSKPIQALVVPREGIVATTEVHNYYRNETKVKFLGGGPEIHMIKPATGWTLTDSPLFWDRDPAIKILYDGEGRHVFAIDWFWHSETLP